MTENPSSRDHAPPPRRSFIVRAAAFLTGAAAGLIPAGLGLGFLLDPLLRRPKGSAADATAGDGFLPLPVNLASLPSDGTPQLVTVTTDRVDAWNFHPAQPVGTVWLRRLGGDKVVAFSSICPHLGCAVEYRSAQSDFYCPCHLSSFDLEGARQNNIPPRGMDQLEVKLVDDRVWVRYENYRGGVKDKIPV